MSSAEARRLARQKKILANQEGRMNRIIMDQKFEPTEPDPDAELPDSSLQNSLLIERRSIPEPVREHLLEPVSLSESEHPPINSATSVADSSPDQPVRRRSFPHWIHFVLWFLFGALVRLLLSSPDLAWLLNNNAVAPFIAAVLLGHAGSAALADPDPNAKEEAGLVYIAIQMCGIPQSSISKLKRAVAVAAAVTESFSVYFVAFLVCHFSVEAAG